MFKEAVPVSCENKSEKLQKLLDKIKEYYDCEEIRRKTKKIQSSVQYKKTDINWWRGLYYDLSDFLYEKIEIGTAVSDIISEFMEFIKNVPNSEVRNDDEITLANEYLESIIHELETEIVKS